MDDPRLAVTAFEADRGFEYSFETARFLTAAHPATRFVWTMGADSLATLHLWERWEEIARLLPLAVYARPGVGLRATRSPAATLLAKSRLPEAEAPALADTPPPAWVYLHGITSTASSTAIRARASSS
jgi:nicotinate-nucleotide adenylyltransferase